MSALLRSAAANGDYRWPQAGWLLASLALFAVLAIGNRPLLSGRAAPQWDAVDFFAPSFSLLGDELRAGHLVEWNPWTSAGTPDWAEPELGTFSPVHLAAAFLSRHVERGYIAFWLAVWAFGGIGMLLLARHLGSGACGGAIAALGFLASGFYTGHAEHLSWLYAVSFLPWIVWRLDRGLRVRDWWCAAQAGVLFGLAALGSYPPFTIVTPGFLSLWTLGRVLCRDSAAKSETSGRTTLGRSGALLALSITIAALICAPPYVGLMKYARGFSDRTGERPREISTSDGLLQAGALSTFASPYLADLNRDPRPLWPRTDIPLTSVYTGAATLILALFGCCRKSGWRWFLAGMAIFFLCCALGSQLPLRGWLYDWIPPTRYFRHAALFRAYTLVTVAILAALGARDLANASTADLRRLLAISLVAAVTAAAAFEGVVRSAGKSTPRFPHAMVHLAVVWFGFVALAFLAKAGWISVANFLRLTAVLAFCDAAGALFLAQPVMYTPDTVAWWHALDQQHSVRLNLNSGAGGRLREPPDFLGRYRNNRNVVLRVPVFDGYSAFQNRFQEKMAADPQLSRMAVHPNWAWFSPSALWRVPDNASFEVFEQRVHARDGQPVLVLHSPQQMLALRSRYAAEAAKLAPANPAEIAACTPAQVSNLSYSPDVVSFRYTAPAHGYLLVTDRWASGWKAMVNGRSRPVLGGDFIFRAVEVDAGVNSVEFTYNPEGFWPLLCLSWGTLFAAAAWQCRRGVRARRACSCYSEERTAHAAASR